MLNKNEPLKIKRQAMHELKQLLKEFPIVTLIGPRQAGKTTLSLMLKNPEYQYFNLEDPGTMERVQADPTAFINSIEDKYAIIDEIQKLPILLSHLQVVCDRNNKVGQFIITGSHQPELRQGISQSLAGRTGILELLPLSIDELRESQIQFESYHEYLINGFLPRLYDLNQRPYSTYSAYFKTYVERDVRQILELKNSSLFTKFLKLLAGRVGQIVDYTQLGNDTGVSSVTVKNWISVLEASYIIYRVQPYFENFGKRMRKNPKIYFLEPGLLSFLLNLDEPHQVARDPLVGGLFENLIVTEVLKYFYHSGRSTEVYYLQDHNRNEIDLLFKKENNIHLIEVKSAEGFSKSFLKNFSKFEFKSKSIKKYLIYAGQDESLVQDVKLINFKNIKKHLDL